MILLTAVAGQTNLEGVKAVQRGTEHEADAVAQYEQQTGDKVEPCGLIVAPNCFPGPSPDGFVGDKIVIEAKCPWRLRNNTIAVLCASDKSFFWVPVMIGSTICFRVDWRWAKHESKLQGCYEKKVEYHLHKDGGLEKVRRLVLSGLV